MWPNAKRCWHRSKRVGLSSVAADRGRSRSMARRRPLKVVVDTNVVAYYLLATEPFVERRTEGSGTGRSTSLHRLCGKPRCRTCCGWPSDRGDRQTSCSAAPRDGGAIGHPLRRDAPTVARGACACDELHDRRLRYAIRRTRGTPAQAPRDIRREAARHVPRSRGSSALVTAQ